MCTKLNLVVSLGLYHMHIKERKLLKLISNVRIFNILIINYL